MTGSFRTGRRSASRSRTRAVPLVRQCPRYFYSCDHKDGRQWLLLIANVHGDNAAPSDVGFAFRNGRVVGECEDPTASLLDTNTLVASLIDDSGTLIAAGTPNAQDGRRAAGAGARRLRDGWAAGAPPAAPELARREPRRRADPPREMETALEAGAVGHLGDREPGVLQQEDAVPHALVPQKARRRRAERPPRAQAQTRTAQAWTWCAPRQRSILGWEVSRR